MIHNLKLPNGWAIVSSSGHKPYSSVVFLDGRGRFLLCCEDPNRRVVDENEALQFAKENAPMVDKPLPKKKGKNGDEWGGLE